MGAPVLHRRFVLLILVRHFDRIQHGLLHAREPRHQEVQNRQALHLKQLRFRCDCGTSSFGGEIFFFYKNS